MKVIPGNIQRSTHLRKPRVLQNPDGNSYFYFDIIKKKANHTWDFFFFFKLQTLWRKLHPEESFHILTKPRLEIGKYHWNRRENKNLKIKRTYRYRKLKFLPEKIKEMSDKVGPSLTSRWRAELEDISLLEGREFAAMELVAWSCIAWLQQKPQQFSLWVLDLAREKERDINVTASK